MNAKRLGKWAVVLGPLLGPMLAFAVFYWGWCWGWWGRDVLLFRYLLQCRCPRASEDARYYPFSVIASPCLHPWLANISPSGRFLLIGEGQPRHRILRLDLETRQTLEIDRGGRLLNDNLLLATVTYREMYLLLDLDQGTQTPVRGVFHQYNRPLETELVELLRDAEQVIVAYPEIVALAHNYTQNPDGNVVIYVEDNKDRIIRELANEGITFAVLSPPYKTGKVRGAKYSQNQQLWADSEGIHLDQSGQLIVPTGPEQNFGAQGWVRNDQAVVYGSGGFSYVIESTGFASGWFNFLPVPGPILLLEVPPQYWATPAPEP